MEQVRFLSWGSLQHAHLNYSKGNIVSAFKLKISWAAYLASTFYLIGSICCCLGADYTATIGEFSNKTCRFEATWKMDDTNDFCAQLSVIEQAYDAILMSAHKERAEDANLNPIAVKLLSTLADKPVSCIIELGSTDIRVMGKMADHLLPDPGVSFTQRQQNVMAFSKYLGRIRSEYIPNYKHRRSEANIMPPEGVGATSSGMDPETITNAILRVQYEATIWTNSFNGAMNARQQELAILSRCHSRRIIDYMTCFFATGQATTEFIQECMQQARLAEKEKAEMWQKINAAKSPLQKAPATNP
jgi:hypothetical protein